jgi:putative membrane protein
MHYHEGHFGGMNFAWWIISFIVFFFIFILVRKANYFKKAAKEDDPQTILKKRFAKGEITKEEYEESNKILKE